jgi:hypothetical protein
MLLKANRDPDTRPQPFVWVFWVVVFLYPILAGLLLQLIVLPYIFPAWHAGDGILVGGDWLGFHTRAVLLSENMRLQGWQVWEARPGGQIVSGIAAVFYTLITPKPWTLLPLNALLHTAAAWALFEILRSITGDWKKALLGAAPFAFFPSSLTWTAQMHNDGYAIPGGMLFISGWVSLACRQSWNNKWIIARSILFILFGSWLLWLVRPYMVTMTRGLSGIFSIALVFLFFRYSILQKFPWGKTAIAVFLFLLLSFASFDRTAFSSGTGARSAPIAWKTTPWIPNYIDRQLRTLSRTRNDVIDKWQHAASNIDTHVSFSSATEILLYLPRAVQIGFLSPFPDDWFGTGSKAPNTVMRRVSGIEMIVVYAALLGLPYAVWRWRKRSELWIVLFFSTGMLVIYAIGVPNMGTLYRFRYAYLMSIAGIGICGGYAVFEYLSAWRMKKGIRLESNSVR